MTRPLVVVGDALLDRDLDGRVERLCPDAPVPVVDDPRARLRPGGAGLAAALAAAERPVTLVTALAGDSAGRELRSLLAALGVDVVDLGLDGRTPEKVRVRAGGRSLLRLDYGGPPGRVGPLNAAARGALASAGAVLVADYGRGVAAEPSVRAALGALAAATPLVWDPHPRGPAPVPGVRLATPNAAEAAGFVPDVAGDSLGAMTARARALLRRWAAAAVVLTLGARGALLVGADGTPLAVPAAPAAGGDPCGAGDRFAAEAAGRLADGALPSEAVPAAVAAATAFVAAGGAAAAVPPPAGPRRQHAAGPAVLSPEHAAAPPDVRSEHAGARRVGPAPGAAAQAVVDATRAAGGTVVATGGCFDLLHAGHVRMLQAARSLGDCLVVCLNSDASVRRRKGGDRPLVAEADRAAVLAGLACVDAVVVFDEDTPEAVLSRLRPDVWAKGADYSVADLPEARVLECWGGQAVVLPYLHDRSTTGLILEATRRAATS